MPRPRRFKHVTPAASAAELTREIDRCVAQFESVETVAKRFKKLGGKLDDLLEIAWISRSPRGARLIVQYLRMLHGVDLVSIKQGLSPLK